MRTVLVFGTFDVLHPGHLYFLREAGRHGDRVVASIARDGFVERTKGRRPVNRQDVRLRHVLETGLVQEARLSDEEPGTYGLLASVEPGVVCLGHDQRLLHQDLQRWLAARDLRVELVVIEAFEPSRYKSSILNAGSA